MTRSLAALAIVLAVCLLAVWLLVATHKRPGVRREALDFRASD